MTAPSGPVLRDIHLPAEPSWWPPAPGWWLIALIVLALLVWQGLRLRRRQRLARARRGLLREFDRANAESGAAKVAALSELLRRTALRYAPGSARLRDEDWLAFLDADDPEQPFLRGPGRLLLDGPYRPQVEANDAAALAQVVRARLTRFVTPVQLLAAPGLRDLRTSGPQPLSAPGLRDIRTSGPQPLSAPGLRDIRTSGPHV